MSRQLSAERRRIVVISSSVAAMSGVAAMLSQQHPFVIWIYGGFLIAAFAYVITQLVKIKRAEKLRKQARREGQA